MSYSTHNLIAFIPHSLKTPYLCKKIKILKTKTTRQDKVNVITLGCSKNLVDSENLITQLKGNDFEVTHESENDDANVVIVNTCLLYTSPSPRDRQKSRMPSSA